MRAGSEPPHLEPVDRGVETATVQAALDALLAGPDEGTTEAGRYDSLIPESTTLTMMVAPPEVTIQLGATAENTGVLSIQGQQQVLAFAQIVATAMSIDDVTGVRFVQPDGSPFAPPTPDGGTVSDRAVTDADYASLLDD